MRIAPLLALALLTTATLVQGQAAKVRGGAGAPAPAAVDPEEKSIWRTEYAWDQARLKGDPAAIELIEAPTYFMTGPDSIVIARRVGIDQLKTGAFKYRSLSRHEAAVKRTGDVAVVTGRIAAEVTVDETQTQGIYAFTDTLVKRDGRWQALATQLSKIAPTARYSLEPLPRDYSWIKRHEKFVAEAHKGDVDLLFLGDSITDFWRVRGAAVYQKYFANLKIANFGISGDRTEHVLWRMQQGELDGIHPKAIMLMIGTKNIGMERDGLYARDTPHEAAEGVKAIVAGLRAKLPDAKILLLAVFPRGHLPTDPGRIAAGQINPEIQGLDDGDHVRYLDIGKRFLTADGVLEPTIMPDFLHPSAAGYEIWAQAVKEPLAEMMK
jgi:lysophospholipase L1-like esterase